MVRKSELLQQFGALYPVPEILKELSNLKGMDEVVDHTEMKDGKQLEYYASPGWQELISVKN
jgi:hypothetical protein